MSEDGFCKKREQMIRWQIENRGVIDLLVIEAIREIPRHIFVPAINIEQAYADFPVPIGFGQTISQPYIVALMTLLLHLTGSENVLEIGTGCGYQTAILSKLSKEVTSLEIIPQLADIARQHLSTLFINNVEIITQDGSEGFPAKAPYQAIIVTAAPLEVPQALFKQLDRNARMVIPVGDRDRQVLQVWEKSENGELSCQEIFPVSFVPFRGSAGIDSNEN